VREFGADTGLDVARALLEPLHTAYPGISYADLYSFTAACVVTNSGGPWIKWRPGRADAVDVNSDPVPDGVLPSPESTPVDLRAIFYRMGFSDNDIVALSGAHNLGHTHTENSGYRGAWTTTPLKFSNEFYTRLVHNSTYSAFNITTNSVTITQFQDNSSLMMLPSDMALTHDVPFLNQVKVYAANESAFFEDFKAAFETLLELGVASGLGNVVNTTIISPLLETATPSANANSTSAGVRTWAVSSSSIMAVVGIVAMVILL